MDLFLGEVSREHKDIEIIVFREDQFHLKEYLGNWNLYKVENHKLRNWGNEILNLPVHEIHAFNKQSDQRFEILLNESDGFYWKYRRDLRVKLPLNDIACLTTSGIPYLKPEIILLYKSKDIRPKDQQDFLRILNYISFNQKMWLANALAIQDPEHQWLEKLRE